MKWRKVDSSESESCSESNIPVQIKLWKELKYVFAPWRHTGNTYLQFVLLLQLKLIGSFWCPNEARGAAWLKWSPCQKTNLKLEFKLCSLGAVHTLCNQCNHKTSFLKTQVLWCPYPLPLFFYEITSKIFLLN